MVDRTVEPVKFALRELLREKFRTFVLESGLKMSASQGKGLSGERP